jgi:hypothetical protein
LRRKPDPGSGRPPIPPPSGPPDARIEAAKSWSPAARAAARAAFAETTAGGGSREEATEAGYRAGLRRELEEAGLPPAAVAVVDGAASVFGARVVAVLPPAKDSTALEERCFERLFPDEGFPKPAARPASPTRRRASADEDDKKADGAKACSQARATEPARPSR